MSGNSSASFWNYTRADLEAVNDERAKTLIPAMCILGLLMIFGIVGNLLVCYIFCCKLRSGTQHFLIVCLAVFDLLSCLIGVPNEIADMRFYYIFESVGSCKIMRFINTFCAIGSIFTLIVIAIDRYRKICRPLHWQLGMSHVRLSLVPILGGALLFGWPAFLMYGLRTTETTIPGLYGQDCSTPDDISETVFPLLYNCILFLCFVILTITLIVIYTMVLRETKRHSRYMKRNSDYNVQSISQYYSEESSAEGNHADPASPRSSTNTLETVVQFTYDSNSTVNAVEETPTSFPKLINVKTLPNSVDNELGVKQSQSDAVVNYALPSSNGTDNTTLYHTNSSLPSRNEDAHVCTNTSQVEKRSSLVSTAGNRKRDSRIVSFNENERSIKTRRQVRSRTTTIALAVTVVFILSFLPHLSLQVTKLLHKGFDYDLQGAELVFYNLFLRSYFINSVSNPFIYGTLNIQFSREVKGLAKRICTRS